MKRRDLKSSLLSEILWKESQSLLGLKYLLLLIYIKQGPTIHYYYDCHSIALSLASPCWTDLWSRNWCCTYDKFCKPFSVVREGPSETLLRNCQKLRILTTILGFGLNLSINITCLSPFTTEVHYLVKNADIYV